MSRCILRKIASHCHVLRKPLPLICRRTVLSSAYGCQEEWSERLHCPIIAKVKPGDFVIKLQESFDRDGSVSPIDMDVLANRLDDVMPQHMDFVQNLFKRFRHTEEWLTALNSTPYAIVRGLLQLGDIERLMAMLKDKVEYGLFLDPHSACLILDHCIKNKQYQYAAEVAFDQMLQEDFSHLLTKALCWYACHLYWKNPSEQIEQTNDEGDEMKYIPVPYIINPYYDDHFDLPKDSMKLGKTLVMLSHGENNLMCNSYRLLGWAYYEKFNNALECLQQIISEGVENSIAKEALDSFSELLNNIETSEAAEAKERGEITLQDLYPYVTAEAKQAFIAQLQELTEKLDGSNIVSLEPLEPLVTSYLQTAIKQHENADIGEQSQIYKQWQQERQQRLDEETQQFKREEQKKMIVEKLLEIQAKEEKLRYFTDLEKINLGISRRPRQRPIEDVKEEELFVAAPGERGRGGA